MAMEKDNIKDLFASKLGNFEPEVPASVWGGLDQLLSNQPIQAPDPTSSTSTSSSTAATTATKASLLKTVVVIVGLTAAITSGIFILNRDKKTNVVEEQPIQTEIVEEPKMEEEIIEEVSPASQVVILKKEAPVEESHEVKEIAGLKAETEIEKEVKPEKEVVAVLEENLAIEETFVAELPKFFTKDVSIGITADLGLFSDNFSQRGGGLLFSRNARSQAFKDVLAQENSDYTIEHKRPISIGLTLSKNINPRLSIETGLNYTYLSSRLTSNSIYNIRESQSFNYLGIPLSINYTFYQLGKTKFYLSAGGMIQKDIRGKYESNIDFSKPMIGEQSTINNFFYQEPYYIKKSIKQSNPQFSLRTRLGIAYPLYKKLYLYGTIGGAYYFDAGNEYRTIYSDKKAQLDVNLGVKYDF